MRYRDASANGFNLTPHSTSFSSAKNGNFSLAGLYINRDCEQAFIFSHTKTKSRLCSALVDDFWSCSQFPSHWAKCAQHRASLNLCVLPRSPCINAACETTRKWRPSSAAAIAGFIQNIHCTAAACREANEAADGNITKYSPVNTSRTDIQMSSVNTDVCGTHSRWSDCNVWTEATTSHVLIRSNEVHSGCRSPNTSHSLPESQCAYPNKSSCQLFLTARNFLTERSHHLFPDTEKV